MKIIIPGQLEKDWCTKCERMKHPRIKVKKRRITHMIERRCPDCMNYFCHIPYTDSMDV